MKRTFDITFSLIGLIILSPLFIIIALVIVLDSRGGIFFTQKRVGRNNKDFILFKFRTMHANSEQKGLLTVGGRDARITRAGYFLRKNKLDELPQLLNVFIGNMSFVGPRPELRKYVDLYDDIQKKVLDVRPGITDVASIAYFDENELLGQAADPEQTYIREVMPAKLKMNLEYIAHRSFAKDLLIILKTAGRIVK